MPTRQSKLAFLLSCCAPAALVLTYPADALAGPHAGGTVLLHAAPSVQYTSGGHYCDPEPISCYEAITFVEPDANQATVCYALAAFPEGSEPSLRATAFGISYDSGLEIVESDHCADVALTTDGWPSTGSGIAITWTTPQTGRLVPMAWFACYASSDSVSAQLSLTQHPIQESVFVDNSVVPVADPISDFGSIGFGALGHLACPYASFSAPGDVRAFVKLTAQPEPTDSTLVAQMRALRDEYGLRVLVAMMPDGLICHGSDPVLNAVSRDHRVAYVTAEPVMGVAPTPPGVIPSPEAIWNRSLEVDPEPLDDPPAFSYGCMSTAEDARYECDEDEMRQPAEDRNQQTSTYLIGDIGVVMFFVESLATSSCDPPSNLTENWSPYDVEDVYDNIIRGAEHLAGYHRDASVTFVIYATFATVDVEPITIPTWNDEVWMYQVIQPWTHGPGDSRDRMFEFNNSWRTRLDLDACVIGLVVDDDCKCLMDDNGDGECDDSGEGAFADSNGRSAYASLHGPRFVTTLHNGGWDVVNYHRVWRHELLHCFGAADEYAAGCCDDDCSNGYGFLNVHNGNCVHCTLDSDPCMMKESASNGICTWTQGQIGWLDSDGDGALDPIDHPASGTAMLIEPVQAGDYVDIERLDGQWLRRLFATPLNSDGGGIVWDGINFVGDDQTPDIYYWRINGGAHVANPLFPDVHPLVVADCTIDPQLAPTVTSVTVEFTDSDTRSGRITGAVRFAGSNVPLVDVFRSKYYLDSSLSTPATSTFYLNDLGLYELDLLAWDVGGGHNYSTTIPFQLGSATAVPGIVAYAPGVRLGPASPNPARGWVRWRVDSGARTSADILIVSVDGRVVRQWRNKELPEGPFDFLWDGTDDSGGRVPSGVYSIVLRRPGRGQEVGRVVVAR